MTTDDGHPQPRDGRGRWLRGVDTAERDAEAARLRSRGVSYPEIARQLGYTDKANARRAIEKIMAEVVREPAEELVRVETERLDHLLREALTVLENEHYASSAGRLVIGPDGGPLADDGPKLAAIDRLLKIAERRSKLLGLDAPSKSAVAVSGTSTVGEVEAALAELIEVVEASARRDVDAESP